MFKGTVIRQVVNSNKLEFMKKIRTLTLSDLHSYTNNDRRLTRLAYVVKEEKPDIIFIAGDIFNDGKEWEDEKKLNHFKKFVHIISEIAPVCITWGNHDLRGMNKDNYDIRIKNLRSLEKIRPGKVFTLYNDKVFINGMEIVGYVPRFELMEMEGLKTQVHGIAHDEFIKDYNKDGVKFENRLGFLNIYLGHSPHLIASSENGIGLEDLNPCDFFITGHMHDGYSVLFSPINKIKKLLTSKCLKSLEFDNGFTEQTTGIVDKDGNYIKRTKKLWLGKTNLCRGIIYIDDASQQKFLQMPDGKFYKNTSNELNVQRWEFISEDTARKDILNSKLHFMLISSGIAPCFLPKEKYATINIVDIIGVDN